MDIVKNYIINVKDQHKKVYEKMHEFATIAFHNYEREKTYNEDMKKVSSLILKLMEEKD